jgi:hypothetical protein
MAVMGVVGGVIDSGNNLTCLTASAGCPWILAVVEELIERDF